MPPVTNCLSPLAHRLAAIAALLGLTLGTMVLCGYQLDRPELLGVLHGWRPMRPNTALCFIFNGLALLCSVVSESNHFALSPEHRAKALRLGSGLAAVPILTSLATLAEYLGGISLGIDALLVNLPADKLGDPKVYRMAVETAICQLLLGSALALASRRNRSRHAVILAGLFALLVLAIATTSIASYFSPLLGLLGWIGLPMMAADTALLLALQAIGTFVLICTQRVFSWELGKRVTAGFIIGLVVLAVIFLTVLRSQYHVSSLNAQIESVEERFAKTIDILSIATQQHSQVLAFLVSDDLNFLNSALITADRCQSQLDHFELRQHLVGVQTQVLLDWSALAIAHHRQGMSGEELHTFIRRGNAQLAQLNVSFDQSENEHRLAITELRRKSDYVRRAASLTIAGGMLANLFVFGLVFVRLNRIMSEQRRVKAELIEREQQYRTLANSGQALVWTAGTDKLCNYFNKIWLDFTGRTLEQEIGNGWVEGVHPEDMDRCVDIYVKAFDKREKFSMDYRLRRHDGEYRWIQDDGSPRYDTQGNFIGYIGFCLDITERKQAVTAMQESELRFRKLLGEIPSVAVQGYGPDLVTHYWNQASERLYGYTADEAIGRKLTDLIIPPEMRDGVEQAVAGMMDTGTALPTEELSLMRKDGSRLSVISSHAIIAVPDKPPELFCVDIDIHQRKEIEAELAQYREHLETLVKERTAELADARDAAEAANRAKSSFLANMSHEIRTPMNAIIGFGHLLRRGLSDPPARAKVDKIMAAAQHLLGIINNILDLSKIEAGRLSLEEKAFSPALTIANTLTMISDRASAKGLRIHREIDPAVPDTVIGDSLRVSQILINYVSNAIKFSDHGDIHVRLALTAEDTDRVGLRLEVEDSGIGLSQEQQGRIFQAFSQADGSTTRRFGGSGLGLVISLHLARSMGGEVGVNSRLGHGSTFWATFYLKKKVTEPSLEGPATVSRPADELLREHFNGLRLLLVEDDLTSREIAIELLQIAGLSIDIATNGFEAIRMAGQNDYPLIIMDMQMPGMGGVEATRSIRGLPGNSSRAVIIAMTANAFEDDRRQCFDAGMNDHLAKPFNADILYATILKWLDPKGALTATRSQ